MNKSEVILKIASKTNSSKASASRMLEAFEEVLTEALANGDDVRLNGLGVFSVTGRAARTGSNPKTGDTIHIPAKKVAKFKPAAALQAAVQ